MSAVTKTTPISVCVDSLTNHFLKQWMIEHKSLCDSYHNNNHNIFHLKKHVNLSIH